MNSKAFSSYAKDHGGRVVILFLLFLLALYKLVTAGLPAFAAVCAVPIIGFIVLATFQYGMFSFWALIFVNYLIMWKELPLGGIPTSLPNEIAIIEYPNLDDNSVPPALLNMGTINLLVTRANRTWKDVDQKALKELQSQLEDQNTLFMYLTEAQRYAVEEFVGQLPPYTKFNNFVYRISQMGLTAVENSHAK
jgi:hypothetical protein